MAKKSRYEKPEFDIVEFATKDVITLSSPDGDGNQGEWDPLRSPWEILK